MKSRTKQSSSISSASKTAACSDSPKGAYPSISAAYWLPAPNTTPYLLPGKESVVFDLCVTKLSVCVHGLIFVQYGLSREKQN